MSPFQSPFIERLHTAAGKLSSLISSLKIGTITATRNSHVIFLLAASFVFLFAGTSIPAVPPASQTDSAQSVSIDPFRDIYPPIAKIIGQGKSKEMQDTRIQSLFYGSGTYVAEVGEFGIVLTNWHVVGEASGPLQVQFSNFSSPGTVIMADTVWDIAAIVIRRPPFLPFPISLEVPRLGDELWVAGFGQQSDLSGYQISSGPVLGYGRPNNPDGGDSLSNSKKNGGPDTKATLPCETIQIGTGIRYGDSGGPIINQYGELAGILWGSDGHLTMGTFCLRLQAFLTQAQFQLMHYRVGAQEFFARAARQEISVKKIAMPSIPAQGALRSSGIFPISSVPVYTSGTKLRTVSELPPFYKPATITDIDGAKTSSPSKEFLRIQADYKNAHNEGHTLPPYPAIQSPTFVAQRKAIGRSHPEVYVDTRFAAAKPKEEQQSAEIQATGASDIAFASANANSAVKYKTASSSDNAQVFQHAALETSSASSKLSAQSVSDSSNNTEGDEKQDTEEKGSWRKRVPGFPQISLNNVQSIIAIVIILLLFINTLRIISIASERK